MVEFNGNKNEIHFHRSGGSFWDFLRDLVKRKPKVEKSSLRILFIDDNRFPIVNNLKKAGYEVGWKNDIKNIDDSSVSDSHIIFVDYKGVGKNLSDKEGVGVCQMLKEKYGKTKYVVLFTGESIPHDLIEEIKSASDENISKNRDTSEYIRVLDNGLLKLNS